VGHEQSIKEDVNSAQRSDIEKADLGEIILKVISDQMKIIFAKKDLKSEQDHIFFKYHFLPIKPF
jgi:hypothetical protein